MDRSFARRRSGASRIAERQQGADAPLVIGELACSNLKNRKMVLSLLQDLPMARVATDDEVLFFVERRELMGRGIGYVDAHLLAAVVLEGATQLWTRGKRLCSVAESMGLAFM